MGHKVEDQTQKVCFYDEMPSEWDLGSSSVMIVSLQDFNGHVGRCAKSFEGVHRENGIGERNAQERRLLEFCDEKELCVANTWFYKADKRKITDSAGECETEINFVLVGKIQKVYKGWELQHRLVVLDLDKKVLKKFVIKQSIVRRKILK